MRNQINEIGSPARIPDVAALDDLAVFSEGNCSRGPFDRYEART